MARRRKRKINVLYKCLGVYASKEGYRIAYTRSDWPINAFVVVKLFGHSNATTVKFWKGSFDKTVAAWNMKKVEPHQIDQFSHVAAAAQKALLNAVRFLTSQPDPIFTYHGSFSTETSSSSEESQDQK